MPIALCRVSHFYCYTECHCAECRYAECSYAQCSATEIMLYMKCLIDGKKLKSTKVLEIHIIVKRVSWFKSSLLLRIQNKHKHKH